MMRMLVFEGTLQEIKELQKEFMRAGVPTVSIEVPDVVTESQVSGLTPGRPFVTREIALRFLTRRPLSREQRAVIASIYRSGAEGVLAKDLQREISYTPSQFAGLMGAFGRRLVNTKGYPGYAWAFDNRWEVEHECNRYRFPPSMREAIEEADLA